MVYYKIQFKKSAQNQYIYPMNLNDINWKSMMYSHNKNIMIGETDEPLDINGKNIEELSVDEATKLINEILSS